MELPKDYWKCTKCGEIFPYKTEKCPIPKCHGDCISVEEESIEKADVFTGGDMLKWVSGGLLIVLIGLILYAVVRNVSDVRLLGRRDVLTTDIEKLNREKATIDGELEPARATIAEADRKQDEEKKRESTEGKDILNNNPPKDWNLDKSKESQQEMLKTVPVNLNYYYKEKVNSYFYNIE